MKRLLTLVLVTFFGTAYAQQDVQFTQYMNNKLLLNPAYAGLDGAICASLAHRTQWIQFAGAPVSQNINAHMPIKKLKGGLGLSITIDRIGKEVNNNFVLDYSFHKEMGSGKLGIGVGLGLLNKQIVGVNWIAPDGTSGTSDPSIPQGAYSVFTPDLSFGLYYTSDRFFVGLSSNHLVEFEAQFTDASSISQARHYYLNSGFTIDLTANLALKPSVLVRSDLASTNFDINATAHFNNKFWAGVSYRIEDAMALLVGMNITETLKFGYSYDLTTSELKNYGSGSHELLLNYCFSIERPPAQPERYRNVRFL